MDSICSSFEILSEYNPSIEFNNLWSDDTPSLIIKLLYPQKGLPSELIFSTHDVDL